MTRHLVQLGIEIDDDVLAVHLESHGGNESPYTNDVSQWDASDVLASAVERGIIDPHECTFTYLHPIDVQTNDAPEP